MRLIQTLLAGLLALVLIACTSLGSPAPQTLNERIAVTVTAVTAVRQSATTLLTAKKLSVQDAENIQAQADNVVAGAQIARSLAGVDPTAADAKLQQTRQVLLALQAYLAAKEAAKP